MANLISLTAKIQALYVLSKSLAFSKEPCSELSPGRLNDLIDEIDSLTISILEDPEFSAEVVVIKQFWNILALARGLVDSYNLTGRSYIPRFFVSTMFKSGTKHLENVMAKSYSMTPSQLLVGANIGSGVHVSPKVARDVFGSFFKGRSFVSSHFECSAENLAFIARFSLPVIVLLRNPAQAALSAFHYLRAISIRDSIEISCLLESPGLLYDETKSVNSLVELENFLFTTHFYRQVEFVDKWLHFFADTPHYKKLLLFHEHLSLCPDFFHAQISNFIGMPSKGFSASIIGDKLKNPNFRKGLTNEWQKEIPSEFLGAMTVELDRLKGKYLFLEQVWST